MKGNDHSNKRMIVQKLKIITMITFIIGFYNYNDCNNHVNKHGCLQSYYDFEYDYRKKNLL